MGRRGELLAERQSKGEADRGKQRERKTDFLDAKRETNITEDNSWLPSQKLQSMKRERSKLLDLQSLVIILEVNLELHSNGRRESIARRRRDHFRCVTSAQKTLVGKVIIIYTLS